MKKFLIIAAIVLLAGVVVNYSLGGFEPIKAYLVSNSKTTLYGYNYEGGHSSDSLSNLINQLREILESSNEAGTLTIVNFTQLSLEKRGVLKQFIGIEWADKENHAPTYLDTLFIDDYNGFQFRVPIKPLVMPSPEKLKNLAKEAATDMDAELMDFNIEQYKDKTLINNFPLK